jgi:hypothetical protein
MYLKTTENSLFLTSACSRRIIFKKLGKHSFSEVPVRNLTNLKFLKLNGFIMQNK